MIIADEDRRKLSEVLLPRVELIVADLRASGCEDLQTAVTDLLADPAAPALRHLRALATLHGNELVVMASLRQCFNICVGLT